MFYTSTAFTDDEWVVSRLNGWAGNNLKVFKISVLTSVSQNICILTTPCPTCDKFKLRFEVNCWLYIITTVTAEHDYSEFNLQGIVKKDKTVNGYKYTTSFRLYPTVWITMQETWPWQQCQECCYGLLPDSFVIWGTDNSPHLRQPQTTA